MWKLKAWELALLLALCVTLAAGLTAQKDEQALSDGLIRLHILANSDAPEDQAEKLQVRDRVLALLAPALRSCESREQALEVIEAKRPEIEALGVTMALGREFYPTRRYPTFALPAGEYVSLRLTLGEGRGQNWWCVVFPPLCTEVLSEEEASDAFLALGGDSAALITGDGPVYELRFRVIDWWAELRERMA